MKVVLGNGLLRFYQTNSIRRTIYFNFYPLKRECVLIAVKQTGSYHPFILQPCAFTIDSLVLFILI